MNPKERKKPESFLGKVPPQAVELEEAVLGALMLEKDAIHQVIDILKEDSFYKDSNKVIFRAILDLYGENEPIDLLTVTSQLRKVGNLDIAGGAFNVTELTSRIASAANIEFHSRIISEMQMKRELIRLSSEIQKGAFEETTDVFDLISTMEVGMADINGNINSGRINKASSLVMETAEKIKKASSMPNGLTGVTSGIDCIDRLTSGWQAADLIVIAARPSMGKTDFAINLGLNSARSGVPAAFFSMEMPGSQVMDRVTAITAQIARDKIKTGNFDDRDWKKFTMMDSKTLRNFIIIDEPSLSTYSFSAKCRKLRMKEGIGLILVDYLQLMNSPVKGSTNDKVSDISRTLKKTAMELKIPIIALSQLSRSVETRGGDKRPLLSDLRDSGAIEQDADTVIFPFRPIYYGITERNDGIDTQQLMEVDIAKHRNGKLDTLDCKYIGSLGKVIDFKSDLEPDAVPISDYHYGQRFPSVDFDAPKTDVGF